MSEILVSIVCPTYNHENYIADAIESFLMQKINFSFEIVIHDDASTDRTAEIVKQYELKYPDIIKPIYQTENQYSKGVKVGRLTMERAKGKYIAACEGDDYWIDPYKLQKQVDYMESNPECSMCVHAAYRVSPEKKDLGLPIRPSLRNKIFTVEEVIKGGGALFATNSILLRAAFGENRPDFFEKAPVGDYPLAIYLALQGPVYYLDEFMSAYRVGVTGSWTEREASTFEKKNSHLNKIAHMLDEINEFTNYKYDTTIRETKRINQFNLLLDQGLFKEAKEGEFKELYSALGIKTKIKMFIKQHFPGIVKLLKRN